MGCINLANRQIRVGNIQRVLIGGQRDREKNGLPYRRRS